MGPERGAFTGGGGAVARPRSAARSYEAAAGRVDDTGRSGKDESGASSSEVLLMDAPFWTGEWVAYLNATGLPDASFTSPHDLAMVAFTASGIGT